MRKWLWGFWGSNNKNIYIKVAFKFRTTPWRVYNLAHGSRTKSYEETLILNKLKQEGVIVKISPW